MLYVMSFIYHNVFHLVLCFCFVLFFLLKLHNKLYFKKKIKIHELIKIKYEELSVYVRNPDRDKNIKLMNWNHNR